MMRLGPVALFYVLPSPRPQVIPGIEPQHHYNQVPPQFSAWEGLMQQYWWLYPGRSRRTRLRYSSAAAQELRRAFAEFQPDVVIADFRAYDFLPMLKEYNVPLVMSGSNVEVLIERDFHDAKRLVKGLKYSLFDRIECYLNISRTKQAEATVIHQANQVWTCSNSDNHLLQQIYGPFSNTQMIPNGLKVSNYEKTRLGKCNSPRELGNKGRTILYAGTYIYPPNAWAAELLIEQIYPQLRQIYPDCHLLLLGRNPTQKMLDTAQMDEGITVTGAVDDVLPYFAAASVMVVPLKHGSGTKLKVLEAFASGCPVITTAKGAEGFNVEDGKHFLLREEVDEIVAGICQLWAEPDLGKKLAQSAFELLQAEYSWDAIEQTVRTALQEVFC
ncbi:MAG: glycosyltransferase [Symploca sp. SIO3E6]|nr:glycosyltransferase [Caldora sp. SIO3E6]